MKVKRWWMGLAIGAIALAGGTVFYKTAEPSRLGSQFPLSQAAQVVRVADGDTLTVRLDEGGRTVKVRLCGVDAPELAQPLGKESWDYLQRQIARAGNRVMLVSGETDRYGRKVAEVFIAAPTPQQPEQEKLLNYEMVRAGMAYRYDKYADRCPNGGVLAEAEAFARSKQLGVWSDPNAVNPWDYRRAKR